MAKAKEDLYIYVPYNTKIVILKELYNYKAKVIDLETKQAAYAEIINNGSEALNEMHPFVNDVLIIVKKIND